MSQEAVLEERREEGRGRAWAAALSWSPTSLARRRVGSEGRSGTKKRLRGDRVRNRRPVVDPGEDQRGPDDGRGDAAARSA